MIDKEERVTYAGLLTLLVLALAVTGAVLRYRLAELEARALDAEARPLKVWERPR